MSRKAWTILAVFLAIIALGLFIYVFIRDDKESKYSKELEKILKEKVEVDRLLSATYSNSGDMLGNLDSVTVDAKELKVVSRYADMHSDPIQVKEYKITKEDINKIDKMIKDDNLLALSNLEINENKFAYDAPSRVLIFDYDNSAIGEGRYESYSINYIYAIPDDGYPLINAVKDYILSLCKEDNLVKEYMEED